MTVDRGRDGEVKSPVFAVSFRARAWLLAPALTGCSQLFGLDPTSSPNAGPSDAAIDPARVTFKAQAAYFGATFSESPFQFSGTTLKAYAIDASVPGGFRALPLSFNGAVASAELAMGAEGLWLATLPPPFEAAPFVYPINDATRNWQTTLGATGDASPAGPPPPDAALDVNINLNPPHVVGDTYQLFATGTWGLYEYSSGATPMAPGPDATVFDPAPIAYAGFADIRGLTATRPLPTIASNDRLYLNRYRGAQLIATLAIPQFTLAPGVNPITGTQTAFAADQVVAVNTDTAVAISRVSTLALPGDPPATHAWQINAVTDNIYTYSNGLRLASGDVDPATGSISANFGNPFAPDLKPLFVWITQVSHTEIGPDKIPWTLYSGIHEYDRTPASGRHYVADVALPTGLSLNGTPLTKPAQKIKLSADQSLEFAFTSDNMGGSDLGVLNCYRFESAPQRMVFVAGIRVLGTRVRIPAWVLPPGARYMCRMHQIMGLPNAKQGNDVDSRNTIERLGFHDSSSFIVQ